MRKINGLLLFAVVIALSGCGGGSGGGGGDVAPPPPVAVTVTPTSASLEIGDTLQFTSEVNRSNFTVTWYVNDIAGGDSTVGTITAAGLYTAPGSVPSPATVTVKAVPQADTTKSATAQVTITAKLTVSPSAAVVPAGETQQFTANKPASWFVNNIAGGNSTVGTIDPNGLYTAPSSVPSPATVTVKAAWQADATKFATATVTITAPSTVSISPTVVTVAAGATQQFTANMAVDWQLSGATGNAAPLGTISTSGLYTAPSGPPLTGNLTVTAVSQSDPTQQAIAIVTVTFSNASLKGHYAVHFEGTPASGPYYVVGSFVADGMGGISDAVFDLNDLSSSTTINPSAAGYAVATDGRGTLIFVDNTNTIGWRFAMDSPDSARVIAFGDGDSGAGSVARQDPASFSAGLSGHFAFRYDGATTGNLPLAVAGMFTAGGAGTLTNGLQDSNDDGTVAGNVNFTGTWGSADTTTGRGEMSISAGSQTTNYVYYLLSGDSFIFSSTDAGKGVDGLALRQSGGPFAIVHLTGDAVFDWGGAFPEDTSSGTYAVGRFTSDGNGNLLSGTRDMDTGGTQTDAPFTGDYTIDANGQGYLSMVRTGATDHLRLYMIDSNLAFFVTRDQFFAGSGQIRPQTGVPFSTSSVDGSFAFSTRGTQFGVSTDTSGQLTFDGQAGTVSGIVDANQNGTPVEALTVTGTFTMSSNGRGVASLNVGGTTSTLGIYAVDSERLFLIEGDPAVPNKFGPAFKQY
jgi:hypothetical protein